MISLQVFEGDRFFYAPRTPEREVRVPLKLQKDLACSLVVKVMALFCVFCYMSCHRSWLLEIFANSSTGLRGRQCISGAWRAQQYQSIIQCLLLYGFKT